MRSFLLQMAYIYAAVVADIPFVIAVVHSAMQMLCRLAKHIKN